MIYAVTAQRRKQSCVGSFHIVHEDLPTFFLHSQTQKILDYHHAVHLAKQIVGKHANIIVTEME